MVLFILTITISVFFHEIGHAAAALSFGAKHRGFGGGFYLFSPVLYADVTDIWRLKKKQRIVVNVAGVYFEFIFVSILIIISQILNLKMLLMVSILVLTQTFYNLIPFIRSMAIGSFLYYILIKNPNSIIYFPISVYKLFMSVIKGNTTTLIQFGKLIPPLVFYIMCYNYIKTLIKKKKTTS